MLTKINSDKHRELKQNCALALLAAVFFKIVIPTKMERSGHSTSVWHQCKSQWLMRLELKLSERDETRLLRLLGHKFKFRLIYCP